MARLFGTDGVRGVANTELTPELAMALGKAGACVLTEPGKRPLIPVSYTHLDVYKRQGEIRLPVRSPHRK